MRSHQSEPEFTLWQLAKATGLLLLIGVALYCAAAMLMVFGGWTYVP